VAAVFHILNHATFKASLFMAVGIIDHETGTRDIRRLSGLWRAMPITATLAMVASAAMAGVPLLNGFLSKEMFFAETVFVTATRPSSTAAAGAATVAGMFSVVYSLRFTADVFFGPPPTDCPRARTSRRTGCACRSRCWCWPACWWARCRNGPSASRCWQPPHSRWWAACCPLSAWRCGMASTCRW
jgi:NADH:ubiquinone oxidoreductase subunit 5 (subunit L)/multisubunit Na+/H+ antiporter MnhA subunit